MTREETRILTDVTAAHQATIDELTDALVRAVESCDVVRTGCALAALHRAEAAIAGKVLTAAQDARIRHPSLSAYASATARVAAATDAYVRDVQSACIDLITVMTEPAP